MTITCKQCELTFVLTVNWLSSWQRVNNGSWTWNRWRIQRDAQNAGCRFVKCKYRQLAKLEMYQKWQPQTCATFKVIMELILFSRGSGLLLYLYIKWDLWQQKPLFFKRFERIQLSAKLLDYIEWNNKSNINQSWFHKKNHATRLCNWIWIMVPTIRISLISKLATQAMSEIRTQNETTEKPVSVFYTDLL